MNSHWGFFSIRNTSNPNHNRCDDEQVEESRSAVERFLEEDEDGHNPTEAGNCNCEGCENCEEEIWIHLSSGATHDRHKDINGDC